MLTNRIFKKPVYLLIQSLPMLILSGLFWHLYRLGGDASSQGASSMLMLSAVCAINFLSGIVLSRMSRTSGIILNLAMLISESLMLAMGIYLTSSFKQETDLFLIMPGGRYEFYTVFLFGPALIYFFMKISDLLADRFSMTKWVLLFFGSLAVIPVIGIGTASSAACLSFMSDNLFSHNLIADLEPGIRRIMPYAATLVISVLTFTFLLSLSAFFKKNRTRLLENGIPRRTILFIAALLLPLAGLGLNLLIPFPVTLQYSEVYILTILNGIFLLLPVVSDRRLRLLFFFLQCCGMPFSLFFFLSFLPYIPLTLIAIFCLGTGLLILAPGFLFYMQTLKIHSELKALSSEGKALPIFIMIAAFSVLPFLTLKSMFSEKASLAYAISYLYGDRLNDEGMRIYREAPKAAATLQKISRIRNGESELPFISHLFKRIVLEDRIMSESKIEDMYKLLSGHTMKTSFGRNPAFNIWNGAGSNKDNPSTRFKNPDIKVDNLSEMTASEGNGLIRTRVTICLDNKGNISASEYIGDIIVPDNVFISGSSLKMGDSFVPAQIFERKAAISVYEQIRHRKQDPILLYYFTKDTVRMHVFPFGSHEKRIATIDFIYPAGLNPEFRFDNKTIRPLSFAESESFKILTPEALSKLPDLKRTPYLHFIVDCGSESALLGDLREKIKMISDKTGITELRVSMASLNILSQTKIMNIDELMKNPLTPIKMNSGFNLKKLIRKIAAESNADKDTFPVYAVISGCPDFKTEELAGVCKTINPALETDFIIHAGKTGLPKVLNLKSGIYTDFPAPAFAPVRMLENGLPVRADKTAVIPLSKEKNNLYGKALDLKMLCGDNAGEYLPEKIKPIVTLSRETGILCPLTAYIAVENKFQEESLKKSEQKNIEEFQIKEHRAEEPPLWYSVIFLILAAAIACLVRKLRSRTDSRAG